MDIVGYSSIWLLAFIGAALVFVPVGTLAGVCVAASPLAGLNPIVLGIVCGSAEAVGELTGYAAGLGGKVAFNQNQLFQRFQNLFKRYAGLTLFFGSIIPNPLFDVMGIAAGSILYPIRKFLLLVFLGKVIKFTWVATGCHWGGYTLI